MATWTPDKDPWVLYDLRSDFSQATDLAGKEPKKLAEMKQLFDREAKANRVYPIGGGLWSIVWSPQSAPQNPATEFTYTEDVVGIPEFAEPKVGAQEVILNLFMNAYEAMSGPPDGPRELAVRTRGEPASVELLVSDTGPGLSDETAERMFEPFFTTKPEGLGLGLSISRSIVRAHGGEIRAVRHPDRGSTISVTLPIPP